MSTFNFVEDIPILGGLPGSSLGTGLKQIVQQTFQKQLR
jgi:hypothetical protein